MPRKWLIVDVDYLGYRAVYSSGEPLFGIMRDIRGFCSRFDTDHIAFCFDGANGIRKRVYPMYKANRRYATDQHAAAQRQKVKTEVKRLRDEILPALGYRNIFHQEGYEADDMIATAARNLGGNEEAIAITADKDLYQVLAPNVKVFHPAQGGVMITEDWFRSKWQLSPQKWWLVKCIAGCETDNIPGVDGVAEILASKYVNGMMSDVGHHGALRSNIESFVKSQAFAINRMLIRLPFEGAQANKCTAHRGISSHDWSTVMARIGATVPGRPLADVFADAIVRGPEEDG